MSNPLNTAGPVDPQKDIVHKAARFGAFGWLAFFVTLFVLIAQNIILALAPKTVLATSDGVVVGQVVFDEARIRAPDQIMVDLKTWVQHCTSVNKNTIYEDLAICVNHMDAPLAEKRVQEYTQSNYAVNIANVGCDRTLIKFDDSGSSLTRDQLGFSIEGQIAGEVICQQPHGDPISQEFDVRVYALLVPRDTNYPLGINVTSYEDN